MYLWGIGFRATKHWKLTKFEKLILGLCICGSDIEFQTTEHWKLTRFEKQENRVQFSSPYLLFRSGYWDKTYTILMSFPCTLWWSPYCWWQLIQLWSNAVLKLLIMVNHSHLLDNKDNSDGTCTKLMLFLHVYLLMMSPSLVAPPVDLELCCFEVNHVHIDYQRYG